MYGVWPYRRSLQANSWVLNSSREKGIFFFLLIDSFVIALDTNKSYVLCFIYNLDFTKHCVFLADSSRFQAVVNFRIR